MNDFSRAYSKLKTFDDFARFSGLFKDKIILDVGSSTGGFTKFALESGAKKVIAIEIGTCQMRAELLQSKKVELYEKTDIMDVSAQGGSKLKIERPDCAVMDVSFTSCRQILKHLKLNILPKGSEIILLFKPQFEARERDLNNGIVKNDRIRRGIIRDFEEWLQVNKFRAVFKMDSAVTGSKGNLERLYRIEVL
jgi:23S rRNA (cytidine1920-2'-O)/16S rRNA (cytidine1409-2'-O)-methyltransferase